MNSSEELKLHAKFHSNIAYIIQSKIMCLASVKYHRLLEEAPASM